MSIDKLSHYFPIDKQLFDVLPSYGDSVSYLVGVAEIAEMMGLTRQRVNQLVNSDPTFPEPEAVLSAGRIWKRAHVEKWLAHREKS